MASIIVSEREMGRIHDHLFEKYPWLCRKNTAYVANVVGAYVLKYDKKFEKDIKEALSNGTSL